MFQKSISRVNKMVYMIPMPQGKIKLEGGKYFKKIFVISRVAAMEQYYQKTTEDSCASSTLTKILYEKSVPVHFQEKGDRMLKFFLINLANLIIIIKRHENPFSSS